MNEEHSFASLSVTSISHHEMYTSWIAAGFTPEQALELLKVFIAEVLRKC